MLPSLALLSLFLMMERVFRTLPRLEPLFRNFLSKNDYICI